MRINLIFPPYAAPSSIPIGIASLKSYIEENMDNTTVKTIDINIETINDLVEGNIQKICNVCIYGNKHQGGLYKNDISAKNIEIFKMARNMIKDDDLFYNKKMFVNYAYPFWDFLERYSNCHSLILRHYLEKKLFDEGLFLTQFQHYIKKTLEGKPDIIGFSAQVEKQIYFSIALAKIIKKNYNVPVVLGGPALFKKDLRRLMELFKFIDFIVVREGEESLLNLCENMYESDNWSSIPNLIWRNNEKIICNNHKAINNLDVLPTPDYSDLKLDKYYFPEIILPISSSRNCPWKNCKFCALNAQYNKKYRERSINKVIDDIKKLEERHGVNNFLFTDSELTANRIKNIGQGIMDNNLNINWGAFARPTKHMNYDILKTAYDSGCRILILGIESLSDRYLQLVNKGTTFNSIINVIKETNKLNLYISCFMLCGIPTQKKEELLNDMKLIKNLQMKYNNIAVMWCLFNLDKYAPFYDEREKYGIKVDKKRILFSMEDGKKVYGEDTLKYHYENKGIYDLLKNPINPNINSYQEAYLSLRNLEAEFNINENDRSFFHTFCYFLDEGTLLLYAKKFSSNSNSFYNKLKSQAKTFLVERF